MKNKLSEIRQRAIDNGMILLSENECLNEVARRRCGKRELIPACCLKCHLVIAADTKNCPWCKLYARRPEVKEQVDEFARLVVGR